MTSDDYHDKFSHLLATGVEELEAKAVALGLDANDTTTDVRDFCKGPKTFCLILGGTGSGKTVAAAEALLNAKGFWNNGDNWAYFPSEGRFVLASDLARLSYFDTSSLKTLGRMERVPWLVVDDLGGEFVTDTWKSNLTELILRRNSGSRKTLLTSNLTAEDFKARYDARIISRIRGNGVVINSGAKDLRKEVGLEAH